MADATANSANAPQAADGSSGPTRPAKDKRSVAFNLNVVNNKAKPELESLLGGPSFPPNERAPFQHLTTEPQIPPCRLDSVGGLGVARDSEGKWVQWMDAKKVRSSQATVSGKNLPFVRDTVKDGNWGGKATGGIDPLDGVVRYERAGEAHVLSVDNTRLGEASLQGKSVVPVRQHMFDEPLPDQFRHDRGTSAADWGEFAQERIDKQPKWWREKNPYGTTERPRVTGGTNQGDAAGNAAATNADATEGAGSSSSSSGSKLPGKSASAFAKGAAAAGVVLSAYETYKAVEKCEQDPNAINAGRAVNGVAKTGAAVVNAKKVFMTGVNSAKAAKVFQVAGALGCALDIADNVRNPKYTTTGMVLASAADMAVFGATVALASSPIGWVGIAAGVGMSLANSLLVKKMLETEQGQKQGESSAAANGPANTAPTSHHPGADSEESETDVSVRGELETIEEEGE